MSINIIKQLLPSIPNNSGVYQFIAVDSEILYVGKAKNLRKRFKLFSYDIGLC
jgi:excinuclease UvrABC nuclease subunit